MVNDSLLAAGTTAAIHTATNPNDGTTSIILAIVSGIIAPFVKALIDKWTEKRKAKKQAKNEQL